VIGVNKFDKYEFYHLGIVTKKSVKKSGASLIGAYHTATF
jgi:hypothetical protein